MSDTGSTVGTIAAVLFSLGSFLTVLYGIYRNAKQDKQKDADTHDDRRSKQDASVLKDWQEYAKTQRERADNSDAVCNDRISRLEEAHRTELEEARERAERQDSQILQLVEKNARNEAWIEAMKDALSKRNIKVRPPGGTDTHNPIPPGGTS